MAVYVDPIRFVKTSNRWPYPQACHMIADDTEELVVFAKSIGLKERHLQFGWYRPGVQIDHHFDITAGMRAKAVEAGAEELTRRDFMTHFWNNRDKVHEATIEKGTT